MRLSIALVCLLALPLDGEDVEGRVKALISDLSSDDAATREAATAALIAVGAPAVKPLEAALASNDAEVRARTQQVLDAIRLEQRIGASAWVVLPAKETPVAEAFEDLTRQTGRKVDTSGVDLSGKTVPGGLGRVPIFEALDRLSRAGGCSYARPFTETVKLEPAPLPDLPLCHDGPFRLTVDEVTVTRTLDLADGAADATTDVEMTIEWEPHVRPMRIASMARIRVATDDKGGSMLVDKDEECDLDHSWSYYKEEPSQSCWTSLGAPSPGATRIARLEGEIDVLFLTEEDEAVFDAEARRSRATRVAGPVEVQVMSWSTSEQGAKATLTVKGAGTVIGETDSELIKSLDSPVQMVHLQGADGKETVAADRIGITTYGDQDRANLQVDFDSLPRGDYNLVVTVMTKMISRPVKFVFRDIPLP